MAFEIFIGFKIVQYWRATEWKTVGWKLDYLAMRINHMANLKNMRCRWNTYHHHKLAIQWQRGDLKPIICWKHQFKRKQTKFALAKRGADSLAYAVIPHNWVSLIEKCCVRFDYYFIPGREGERASVLIAVFIRAHTHANKNSACGPRKTKIEVWRAKNERERRSVGEWPGHSLAAHCVSLTGRTALQRWINAKNTVCPAVR